MGLGLMIFPLDDLWDDLDDAGLAIGTEFTSLKLGVTTKSYLSVYDEPSTDPS